MTVRIFDRDLGAAGFADRELGHATTADDGHYEIRYTMPAGAKLKPDLIVRVAAAAGAGTTPAAQLTVESKLIPNAPTVAMVELGLEGSVAPRSEHDASIDGVHTVLARSKIALADLKSEHVDYVAGASGLHRDRVRMIANAERLARDAGGAVGSDVMYGLLRSGHQGDLDGLVDAPLSVTRARLENAIAQNHMSRAHAPKLDSIMSALREVAVARAIPAKGTTVISNALANSFGCSSFMTASSATVSIT
jgi:hypothetical protein